jgi:GTPase
MNASTYELRVAGHLDDHWSTWLGALSIARHDDGTSTLTGPIADQAQLHGVLDALRDLGVTLISLHALHDPGALPDEITGT